MKKYTLHDTKKLPCGTVVHQIIALKNFRKIREGDLGGWVENENNLSQFGDSWISGDAVVFGKAKVYSDAEVYGAAVVYGNARIHGDARIYGDAIISGNANIYGFVRVFGAARISGNSVLYGRSVVMY